jgi:hypothetical protein
LAIDHSTHQEHVGVMRGEHLERLHLEGSLPCATQVDMGPGIICSWIQLLLEDKQYSNSEDCNVPILGHYYITVL